MANYRVATAPVLMVLVILASGCGREWVPNPAGPCVFDSDCFEGYQCVNGYCIKIDTGDSDGGGLLLQFGERCEDNLECLSGFCLPHPEGSYCTRRCDQGCPPGWSCKYVVDPRGGTDRLGLCAITTNRLCRECAGDLDCHPSGSDLCLAIGDGDFCSMDCRFVGCPAGYTCTQVDHQSGLLRQCLPAYGCSCSEESAGMLRGCERVNQYGTCIGYEECAPPAGWTDCNAREPAPEDCNGIDDDCNGFIDEDLEGAPCRVENLYGSCRGVEVCWGMEGWICGAPEPALESCDGVDNDCDSATDEDFRDGQGLYVSDQHCGECGVDCAEMIEFATETACQMVDGAPACRALACEMGYFVFAAGEACLKLPENLCQSCSTHEDCLAPGSLCIEDGSERYCGRDCSAGSPYGPGCPVGYRCEPWGQLLQCRPESGTCLCVAETQGTIRSCQVDTCSGYQECRLIGGMFMWSECNVEDYNVEICDGQDNNCNGMVDEGYLNPATGRYETDEHCGFCNNDCSLYWAEEIDHTVGVCDIDAPGMPTCVMGPCSQETENGVDYEWVDVNRDPGDGCECRRLLGNTGTDLPDLIGDPVPGLEYLDENCDGIDGVVSRALFVRAQASGSGNGTLQNPYPTIAQAIAAFPGSGKSYILVAEGSYDESVNLAPGAVLHGGYSADFLQRDVALYQSVIRATGLSHAVRAVGISNTQTLLSGFVIRGLDAGEAPVPDTDGLATVSIRLSGCDDSLVIRSNQIVAGRGGDGGRGSSGEAGFGGSMSGELDGGDGLDGLRRNGACPAGSTRPGGGGGHNRVCPASDGNRGGTTVCPVFDWSADPVQGAQAEYTTDANGNGLGGYDWSFDSASGDWCGHATESGYPTNSQLNVGRDGKDGFDGVNGQGGGGGQGRYGSMLGDRWVAAPLGAVSGTAGTTGRGGGGGGGGGGTMFFPAGGCQMHELGPSGGGGGAGGCGGQGGQPGRAGGASIAVMIISGAPELSYNLVQRGIGGRGGDGGFGGMGGLGGIGGFGGDPPDWISSQGGKGGDGGNGGPGGGGGGGVGGPSFGVLGFNASVSGYASTNTFVYDDTVSTGGTGGAGGGSVGSGASGEAGELGASLNLQELVSCPAGGCPAGTVCDAYGVCVPSS